MDSDFKAFIAALIVTPFAFALVALIEKVGVFSFSKYGALQLIIFLVGVSYVVAQQFFAARPPGVESKEGGENETVSKE